MTVEINSYDIGAHRILFTPNGGQETDLGMTEEGSEINVEVEIIDIKTDEVGLVDQRAGESKVTATAKLSKSTLENISIALDMLKTAVVGPPAATSVDVNPKVGKSLTFGKLLFRPRDLTASDKSKDKTIYKALVNPAGALKLSARNKQIVDFKVTAAADQDATTGKWRKLTIGDPTTAVLHEI